jgi:hypothetical protein
MGDRRPWKDDTTLKEEQMGKVVTGRYTAQADGSLVVFLIGMRINHLWAVRKWVPTFLAMAQLLSRLFRHPDKGFLGAQTIFYWRGIGLVQYWRSFDDLERFARSPSEPHLAAWRRFNRVVGYQDGSVGFWHDRETRPGAAKGRGRATGRGDD